MLGKVVEPAIDTSDGLSIVVFAGVGAVGIAINQELEKGANIGIGGAESVQLERTRTFDLNRSQISPRRLKYDK